MQVSYHGQPLLPDLSGNCLGALGALNALDPPLQSIPAYFIPAPQMYGVVLISRRQNKDTCLRKILPYLSMTPLSSHNNFWLAPWLSGY